MFTSKAPPLALVVLLALGACSSETPGRAAQPTAAAATDTNEAVEAEPTADEKPQRASVAIPKFSKNRAMIHVRKLASDIGVREKGTEGERRGAKYMARKLRGFGYEVEIQRFTVDGRTSRNVVAKWPGARAYGLVIGGHLDTVPASPGANDNASGIGAIIELARIFKGSEQVEFLSFVGFGAEEYGPERVSHHDGSRHFVRELGRRGRRRLAGAISVDMIADGRPLLVGNSNISGHHRVANTLHRKISRKNIATERITLCDCSDHGPFEHAGIDAGFVYSGREADYHSPSDQPENLSPDDLLRTGRAMRFFLLDVDKALLDRFRRR